MEIWDPIFIYLFSFYPQIWGNIQSIKHYITISTLIQKNIYDGVKH